MSANLSGRFRPDPVQRSSAQEIALSVVVPAYNEEQVLPEFHRRISAVLDTIPGLHEVVYVNDGSSDTTLDILMALRETDPRVAIVDLSRNFGKEVALTAGIDYARGAAVAVIDADLQDPPELIPTFLDRLKSGNDVVYGQRSSREGETWLKRATAAAFYRLMQKVGEAPIPADTGDFRIMSRRAVDALCRVREHHRFMKGLFAWIGFRQVAVPYKRDARYAGTTKWSYWRLVQLSIEGITSFTTAPLKFATYIGLLTAVAAFLFGSRVLYHTLVYGDPVQGWPSLMVVISFLGGVQLTTIGILGEYLSRVFTESKARPLYIVMDHRRSWDDRSWGVDDTNAGRPHDRHNLKSDAPDERQHLRAELAPSHARTHHHDTQP